MTTLTITQYQGLFFTVQLNQGKPAGLTFAYHVKLTPHREEDWAAAQTIHYDTLAEASAAFRVAVKNAMTADAGISQHIEGEFMALVKEWDNDWHLEDATTGAEIRRLIDEQRAQG